MTPVDVLALGNRGSSLHVTLDRSAQHTSWFSTTIDISAHPWQGTLTSTFTHDDLHEWSTRLRGTAVPRTVVLGGGRATELIMHIARQRGGTPGSLTARIEVTPSGDDPYPFLRFLLFDLPADFADRAATAVDAVLAS